MDNVQIQVQDDSGNWRTMLVTLNDPQTYSSRMKECAQSHPNRRVRVIDNTGRLLDLM